MPGRSRMKVRPSVPQEFREPGDRLGNLRRGQRMVGAPIIVFNASRALLFLGDRDVEVEVEIIAERGGPGKRPSHPLLVGLQFHERRARHRPERDVVVGEMHREAVESVGDHRARRTACLVIGPEHEVVDEELRAPAEKVVERGRPFVGVEPVGLVDFDPRQLLAPLSHFVAEPGQFFFALEQREPGVQPFLARNDWRSDWIVHRCPRVRGV